MSLILLSLERLALKIGSLFQALGCQAQQSVNDDFIGRFLR
jgi:hypothetical protein